MQVRRDIVLRTSGIFERITNKKIYITFKDDVTPAVSQYSSNSYLITFPKETTDRYWYRSFEHELSHIVFKSSFRKIQAFVKKFPTNPNLAHYVLNLVEDVRVDSLWNEVYRGSAEMRKKQLQKFYKEFLKRGKQSDVLEAVSFAYFKVQGLDIDEDIPVNLVSIVFDIADELEKVKRKSFNATFVVATRIMEKILSWKSFRPFRTHQSQPLSKALEQMRLAPELPDDKVAEKELSNSGDHTAQSVTKKDEREVEELLKQLMLIIEKESEILGKKEVEEIKKKLERAESLNRIDPKEKTYGKVALTEVLDRTIIHAQPKREAARRLRKYFAKLRLKYKEKLSEEGEEIDIDAYMNHIHEAEKPVFLSEEKSLGAYIGILVDYSGSMEGTRIRKSVEACLTIQEAVKKVPEIRVEFFPFHDKYRADLCISKIADANLLKKIKPQGYTPTSLAVYWAGQEVLKQPQAKKFLIIITDGRPEDGKHSFELLATWTRNTIEMLRKKGVKVFTLFIEPSPGLPLTKIFGPEGTWIKVEQEEIDEKIVEFFRLVVENVIKR